MLRFRFFSPCLFPQKYTTFAAHEHTGSQKDWRAGKSQSVRVSDAHPPNLGAFFCGAEKVPKGNAVLRKSRSGDFCEALLRGGGELPGAHQRLPLGIFKTTSDKNKEVHQGPDAQTAKSFLFTYKVYSSKLLLAQSMEVSIS
jgi:hypothetical protein